MKVKKLLCTIIAVAMVLGTMSLPAFAEEISTNNDLADALSLAEPGDTIQLSAGEFAPFTVPEGVTVEGVIGDTAAESTVIKNTDAAQVIVNDGAVLKNLWIDNSGVSGNQQAIKCDSSKMQTGLTLQGCRFYGSDTDKSLGLYMHFRNITIDECYFENFNRGYYTCGDNHAAGKMTFTGNTFVNVEVPIDGYWGKPADETTDITITGNTFDAGDYDTAYVQLWDYAQYLYWLEGSASKNNPNGGSAIKATIADNEYIGNVEIYATHCDWYAKSDITLDAGAEEKLVRRQLVEIEDIAAPDGIGVKNADGTDITSYDAPTAPVKRGNKVVLYAMPAGDYMLTAADRTMNFTVNDVVEPSLDAPATQKITKEEISAVMGAEVNGKSYLTLKDAVDAAGAGDTVTLLNDIVLAEAVTFSKNITLDLDGHTIADTGIVTYGLIFDDGDITLKNGTIASDSATGMGLYIRNNSVVMLDNVTVTGNSKFGMVYVGGNAKLTVNETSKIIAVGATSTVTTGMQAIALWNNATLNVYGTVTAKDHFAIADNGSGSPATTINIYEGAVIESTGSIAIYHPGGGILTISGGTITGNDAVYVKSGKTVITGGTLIGNGEKSEYQYAGSGAYSTGDALVIESCNYPNGTPEMSVSGGTFKSTYANAVGSYAGNGITTPQKEFIFGGTFSSDVTEYVPEGYGKVDLSNGSMLVVDQNKSADEYITSEVGVDFVPTADGRVYEIYVTAKDDGKYINRLTAAELKFAIKQLKDEETGKNGDVTYTITNTDHVNIIPSEDGRYEFNFDGIEDVADKTDTAIKIGEVVFGGYGRFAFAAVSDEKNKVHATKLSDNIVTTYTADGAATGEGVLTVNEATTGDEIDENQTEPSIITDTLTAVKQNLTVKVTFPNAIEDHANEYQQMWVTITGGDLDAPIVKKLGTDVKLNADGNYEFTEALSQYTSYNVTVEGEGYRTVRYSVNIGEQDKTLTFWNNVKDVADVIEAEKTTGAVKTTFLAGDIVRDNEINLYDLSAVVSYFGMVDLDKTQDGEDFAKYDLNRDGKIDSKDIAMVLVSWNY